MSRGWFAGRSAIVTGASRGIGAAVARRLAAEEAALVLTAAEPDELAAVVEQCRQAGVPAVGLPGDLADPRLPRALVELAVGEHGRVDTVVNNAFWESPGSVLEVDLDGWERTLRVTLTAPMLLTQCVLPQMVEVGGGSIVNVSSQRAFAAGHGLVAYETAKAGLLALTRSTAVDFGPDGVRCNCVSPGLVLSERVRGWYEEAAWRQRAMTAVIPASRPAEPNEVAAVVAFVAGPEASYLNGTTVAVDGGALAGLPENAALELAKEVQERERPS